MSAPVPAGEKAKIDPFHHVIDAFHFEAFEGWRLDLPYGMSKFLVTLLVFRLFLSRGIPLPPNPDGFFVQ